MKQFIEKKIKTEKALRIVLIIIVAMFFGSFSLFALTDEVELQLALIMPLAYALLIIAIIYFFRIRPFVCSVKALLDKNCIDDINLAQPTFPKSKIYCGEKAFFSKNPCVIIPYENVAWVYVYEQKSYGITVQKSVIIYTKDAKKYTINAKIEDFQWLINQYIAKNSPNLIVGYGAKQKKLYKELNPATKKASKKTKKISGAIMMAFAGILLTIGLINQTIEIPGIVLLLALFIGGGLLLFLGIKKSKQN